MSERTKTAAPSAEDRPAGAPTILWVFSSFGVNAPNRRLAALINHLETFEHAILALDEDRGAEALLGRGTRWRRVKTPKRRRALAALGDLWAARRSLVEQKPALLATVGLGAMNWLAVNRGPGAAPLIHFQRPIGPEEALEGADGRGNWTRRQAFAGRNRLFLAEDADSARLLTEAWGVPEAAVRRPLWPVDLSAVRPTDRSGRKRITFGALTPLTRDRRHDRLLRILASLVERGRDVAARFVGEGPEQAQLEILAETLGVSDRVSFIPRDGYDPAVAAEETKAMDVYVDLPDVARIGAGPALALAAGLPILGAKIGAVAEAAAELNTLFVRAPEDESALAAAAELLAADEGLRRRLGAANRARAAALHAEGVVMSAYDAVIEEAVGAVRRLALPAPETEPATTTAAKPVAQAAEVEAEAQAQTPAPKEIEETPEATAAEAAAPAPEAAAPEAAAPEKPQPARRRKKPAAKPARQKSASGSALAGMIAGGVAEEALRQARHAEDEADETPEKPGGGA